MCVFFSLSLLTNSLDSRAQEDVGRIPDELLQVSHSSGNSGSASNHGNGDHKTEMALSRTVAASAFDVPKQASLQ